MKACPRCLSAPNWNFARNTSNTLKADHWILSGCPHVIMLFGGLVTKPDAVREEAENKWDAYAQIMFDDYTRTWNDAQRATFKERIWPTPPPVIPLELFDSKNQPTKPADIAAVKAWNETHRANDMEDSVF